MRGITMWKGTEEELKKMKKSRHECEMSFLENKHLIVKEINEMYQNDLEHDMTILNKEDWLTNFFMELYMAVNIFNLEEDARRNKNE